MAAPWDPLRVSPGRLRVPSSLRLRRVRWVLGFRAPFSATSAGKVLQEILVQNSLCEFLVLSSCRSRVRKVFSTRFRVGILSRVLPFSFRACLWAALVARPLPHFNPLLGEMLAIFLGCVFRPVVGTSLGLRAFLRALEPSRVPPRRSSLGPRIGATFPATLSREKFSGVCTPNSRCGFLGTSSCRDFVRRLFSTRFRVRIVRAAFRLLYSPWCRIRPDPGTRCLVRGIAC